MIDDGDSVTGELAAGEIERVGDKIPAADIEEKRGAWRDGGGRKQDAGIGEEGEFSGF